MQIKTFQNVSYDNVFRAFKTVLQDEGYIIKNQDYKGGLITAELQKKNSAAFIFLALSNSGKEDNSPIGKTFQVTVNLEEISKNTTETRVIIQKKTQYRLGGTSGSEIIHPKLYKTIYQQVSVEIKRRQAKGL